MSAALHERRSRIPGYESERGVFSEINPALPCPDGTYYTKPYRELGFSSPPKDLPA